uniref:Uncharacterized protein n=1 Tax=Rhizophora mucronata TaxID=61149 RepID=A0A2P2MY24_RHIMU
MWGNCSEMRIRKKQAEKEHSAPRLLA